MRGGQPGADVGGNARRASATRGCARGRNSGAGAQGERQDGPEQIVHVGVPDRAGQIVADHPVRVPAGRSGEYPKRFLEGFLGYLHTDGYAGYNQMPGITRCGCFEQNE